MGVEAASGAAWMGDNVVIANATAQNTSCDIRLTIMPSYHTKVLVFDKT